MYKTYNALMARNFHTILVCCTYYSAADGINFCSSAITQVCTDRSTAVWIVDGSIFNFFTNFFFIEIQSGCCCCLYCLMDQLAAQIPRILVSCKVALSTWRTPVRALKETLVNSLSQIRVWMFSWIFTLKPHWSNASFN